MAPRSLSFVAGFACGALLFIAMQSFGQSDEVIRDEVIRAPAPELPRLGEAPEGRRTEKEKNLFIPVAVTVGMIGVMSLYGQGSTAPCATYPCAHYAHVGTGAMIGYLFTAYYGPKSALGVGLGLAVGKELMDKRDGKSFSRTDVVTRLLGTGVGVYIARTF
jgi:hypothetical protein